MTNFILSLIFTYFACMGFEFLFHIRGKLLFIAPIGGVIIWAAYLLFEPIVPSVIVRTFIATIFAALFCEITARVMKIPVISFMVISILPLVPGSGIYYTMLYFVQSDYEAFALKGVETIGIAGALAIAIIFVSTIFRIPERIRALKK